jgi:hypothetical protein
MMMENSGFPFLYIFGISSKDVLKLREIDYNKHSTFCERRTGNLLFHLSLNINTYSMQRIHYQRETSVAMFCMNRLKIFFANEEVLLVFS